MWKVKNVYFLGTKPSFHIFHIYDESEKMFKEKKIRPSRVAAVEHFFAPRLQPRP
jgi:hypothetical protein